MEYRIEHDSMGEVKVPADKYWAAQTQRSSQNFPIGVGLETMPREITHAFGILKKAAAMANHSLKPEKMTDEKLAAISQACDEVMSGSLNAHFPLVVWQTGSGTQSNMNANEVIANRGNEIAGKKLLHPNDDVNMSQSSNDTFPTAMHISAVIAIEDKVLPAIDKLVATFKRLEAENEGIVKSGRTHLQDATPIAFSQEISGWRSTLERDKEMLQAALLDIMAHTPDLQHIFLNKRKKEHPKKGYLVMTADRGLAGAYNHNITKMAEENINEDDKLFVIGYMGRNYFGRRNAAQMDEDFFYTTQDPTIYRARRIAEKMIEEYVSGELDEVYIIYTKMITSITSEPKMIRVLPLNPDQYEFAGKGKRSHMTEFQPSVKAVLDRLAPNYIKGLVYGAMVESFSSELNARMMAMEGASKSAREMIRSLGLMYNRARQAAITQEITEVCAGAKSLKKE